MKTLEEQIQTLKESESNAWKRYDNAVIKEVNALLKRMGAEPISICNCIRGEYRESVDEGKNIKDVSKRVLAFSIVKEFDYIIKLRDKWLNASGKLTKIKLMLDKE